MCTHTMCMNYCLFWAKGSWNTEVVSILCKAPLWLIFVICLFPGISAPTSHSPTILINNCSNVFNVFLQNAVMMLMPVRCSLMLMYTFYLATFPVTAVDHFFPTKK